MFRISKSLLIVLAAAVFVTSCAGGNTANNRDDATQSGQMAGGITGQGVYDPNTRANNPDRDMLPGNGLRSPYPRQSVRPLNQASPDGGGTGMRMQQQGTVIPYFNMEDGQYIAAEALVQLLEYKNSQFDADTNEMQVGDTDVFLRLRANSKEAELAGAPVTLSAPPKMVEGKLMIPKSAVIDLFQEEMVFDVTPEGLVVYPSDGADAGGTEDAQGQTVDDGLDFADDPSDPFKGDEDAEGVFLNESELPPGEAVPALKNINMNSLIRTAKRYLGVKYRFGAGPYPRTNRFDCSSYTRYVFAKYGVSLPRTARQQIRVGNTVSRKSLRRGDLLFFYVPGRFKSNKTAGHVGIYMGNGRMIDANTGPKNGVQIHNINSAYWKRTFLRAKRVAY
ncbi:C40 family peptidase [Paenibacillus alkalitolerans]|uniref:C40 family peptidase n=1 Tax=Paenibacillus alkalitolerans TaxID=2799335 RepID=UPI001F299588|nr:C40 family peptidase [Paenibacillus alkalitolerans]